MEQFAIIQGRQGRLAYGIQLALVLIPLIIVHPLDNTSDWGYLCLATLLIIICTGVAVLLAVRRLHDLGLSGWHTLLFIVPVLNLPGLLLLALVPGLPSPNRWGKAPLPHNITSRLQLSWFSNANFRLGWWRMLID
jgi:uncharacterized membrane protein YhaH (DUF805 family)